MQQRSNQKVGVGVIGLGFMGATHIDAYAKAARDGFACELRAVCDNKSSRDERRVRDGVDLDDPPGPPLAFDAERVRTHCNAEELLSDPQIDLVSICTPTDTHVELSIEAMRAGKHVLLEKPVALLAEDIRRVRDVARETKRLCMPAMCLRFWPAWEWLNDRIVDGALGKCRGLTLTRIGSRPQWSRFYGEVGRSGGALVDLHIHDVDFIRYCFGDPQSVTSTGSINHITTIYRYDDSPVHVAAEGGWLTAGTAFRMRYIAEFDVATADYDVGRKPELLLYRNRQAETISLSELTGYDNEVRHMIEMVRASSPRLRATLEEAIAVVELLDAERRSIETRQPVPIERRDSTP